MQNFKISGCKFTGYDYCKYLEPPLCVEFQFDFGTNIVRVNTVEIFVGHGIEFESMTHAFKTNSEAMTSLENICEAWVNETQADSERDFLENKGMDDSKESA